MPYKSSPCRLNDHRRCPGTAAHFDELHDCACPCHFDYPSQQRRPTPTPTPNPNPNLNLNLRLQHVTSRPTEPPPGYLPAGLDGAQHARRLAIALTIAALAYLALCVISAGVAHAAASLLSR